MQRPVNSMPFLHMNHTSSLHLLAETFFSSYRDKFHNPLGQSSGSKRIH